jgi:hypothetical protein
MLAVRQQWRRVVESAQLAAASLESGSKFLERSLNLGDGEGQAEAA